MTVQIHGKEYMEVNERLRIFRKDYPKHALVTEIHTLTDTRVVMKASVIDDEGVVATGHAYEDQDSSTINKTSFVENCETSAWGRALANLGIGIDMAVASSDEVKQAIKQQGTSKPSTGKTDGQMSEKQRKFIKSIGTKECGLSDADVVNIVRWKAEQLGVDPNHYSVARVFLGDSKKGDVPKEVFSEVLLEWEQAMGEELSGTPSTAKDQFTRDLEDAVA